MGTGWKFCQKICDESHTFVYNSGDVKQFVKEGEDVWGSYGC